MGLFKFINFVLTSGIKNSPYDTGVDVYRAEIRWRKPLESPLPNHQFGVGVRYHQPFTV